MSNRTYDIRERARAAGAWLNGVRNPENGEIPKDIELTAFMSIFHPEVRGKKLKRLVRSCKRGTLAALISSALFLSSPSARTQYCSDPTANLAVHVELHVLYLCGIIAIKADCPEGTGTRWFRLDRGVANAATGAVEWTGVCANAVPLTWGTAFPAFSVSLTRGAATLYRVVSIADPGNQLVGVRMTYQAGALENPI